MSADGHKSQPSQVPASPPSQPAKSQGESNMPSIVRNRTTRTTVADKWVFISRE